MFNFLSMRNNYAERVVGRYEAGQLVVSTARVTDADQPYETAVAHPLYDGGKWVIVAAYADHASALFGHGAWVERMTAPELPETLTDVANSPIAQLFEGLGGSLVYRRSDLPEVTDEP